MRQRTVYVYWDLGQAKEKKEGLGAKRIKMAWIKTEGTGGQVEQRTGAHLFLMGEFKNFFLSILF